MYGTKETHVKLRGQIMNVQRIDPGSRIYKAAKQNLFVFPLNLPIIRRTKHWNHFFPFINFHIKLWNYVYSLEIKNSRDRMRTFILDIHQWRIENLDTFFFFVKIHLKVLWRIITRVQEQFWAHYVLTRIVI